MQDNQLIKYDNALVKYVGNSVALKDILLILKKFKIH